MSMPGELKFIEKILERFQYQASPGGLLRIAGWTLLSLVLIGPQPTKQPVVLKGQVIGMNTGANNLQWVRNDFGEFPADGYLNVAWISGSSIKLAKGRVLEYLPQKVNRLMSSKEGIPTRDFVYLIDARRILDTYTMVLDALARKPDAMVLVINPFWAFNSKAVFLKQNLFNHGARLWWNASDWPWQFALTEPANHLYNLVGRHVPLITDRNNYIKYLREKSRELFGVSLIPSPVTPLNRPGNETLKLSQPLKFWLLFQVFNGDAEQFFPNGQMNTGAWQLAAMSQADTDLSSWPVYIMRKMLNKIRASGVPTLLYVAPVSSEMRGMGSRKGYNAVLNTMQNLKSEYENDRLRFVVRIPASITNSLSHSDYLHLSAPGELPAYLSTQLSEIVSSK